MCVLLRSEWNENPERLGVTRARWRRLDVVVAAGATAAASLDLGLDLHRDLQGEE
jgi:hypothetical protein